MSSSQFGRGLQAAATQGRRAKLARAQCHPADRSAQHSLSLFHLHVLRNEIGATPIQRPGDFSVASAPAWCRQNLGGAPKIPPFRTPPIRLRPTQFAGQLTPQVTHCLNGLAAMQLVRYIAGIQQAHQRVSLYIEIAAGSSTFKQDAHMRAL
jgi:hypothetical protein